MKIIYAVAGEGYGHATRSKPIIEHLLKNHQVKIYAGGKAYDYLKKYFPVTKISSMHIKYRNNKVSNIRTAIHNAIRSPLYTISAIKLIKTILTFKPDAIVTDFEPWSSWTGTITRTPVISIDLPAQSFLRAHKKELPKKYWQILKTQAISKMIIPNATKFITPSFYSPKQTKPKEKFVNPIIRQEITKLKSTIGNHILVYQTSTSNKKLINTLKQIPEQKFIAYGYTKTGQEANIEFKIFNEKEFFNELASAKAVITNGGISLLTEAIYLQKPILSIPIQGQGEQLINAYYLEKMRYGKNAHKATKEEIEKFIKEQKTTKETKWNVQKTLKQIEQIIIKSSRKQNNE